MMEKRSLLCLGLLCLSLWSLAQNEGKFRSLISETGSNIQSTLDQRYTANAIHYVGFQTRTGYEFGNHKKTNRIEIHFAKNFEKDRGLGSYINLNSGFRYAHLRVLKQPSFLVGGYVDYGNILIFPPNGDFENNPIAYSFWLSAGIAAKWHKQIQFKQQKMNVSIDGAFPLLGYVIRPAHAHPYPDNYLVDGIFDFERKGMGKYLLKAGQLQSLNKFNNAKIKTTIGIPFGEKGHEIGLSYNWEFLWIGGVKKIWHTQHQLSLHLKFNFHAK